MLDQEISDDQSTFDTAPTSGLDVAGSSTTLAEMAPRAGCRVLAAAGGAREIQSRLYALGLYPGVTVNVLRYAPAGDPIQIRVGSTLLSIRKSEARLIVVEAL